jgi:hypothetical protein
MGLLVTCPQLYGFSVIRTRVVAEVLASWLGCMASNHRGVTLVVVCAQDMR